MDEKVYTEDLLEMMEQTLDMLQECFGKGKFLVHKMEMYSDELEVIYETDEYKYVGITLGLVVITEAGEEWSLMQDYKIRTEPDAFEEQHVKDLIDGMKNWMDKHIGFASRKNGEFKLLPLSYNKSTDISFTLSVDVFCLGIVVDSLQGEGYKTPIVMDHYKTTGLNNLGDVFNQVKEVSVWDDYKLTASLYGYKGEYRIGQTSLKVLYEKDDGMEESVSLKVPFILKSNEDKAWDKREGWQNYILQYFNN